MQIQSIVINGQKVSYRHAGVPVSSADQVILFLHGWGGSSESFSRLWKSLSEHSDMSTTAYIAIDFPGFGDSPVPSAPWSVQDYADVVDDFLDELGIESCAVVVHSFGGRVLWKLLSSERSASRFSHATVIAAAGIRHWSFKRLIVRGIARMVRPIFAIPGISLLRPIVYKAIGAHDYAAVSGVMRSTFQLVVRENLRPLITDLPLPCSVIWGRHDSYVPVSDADIIYAAAPERSSLTLFEDGKHAIHRTHADAIAQIIADEAIF